MTYWLVMAIVALALIAVVYAIAQEEVEPEITDPREARRPVWVALGSSAATPSTTGGWPADAWVEVIRQEFAEGLISYDFTRFGATAAEIQRDGLDAAIATNPDVVTILVGPDDFRDAEDLNLFERRLWHIVFSLREIEAVTLLGPLPDLTSLPSLAAEDDITMLTDELKSWNVAIERIAAAVGAEMIDDEAATGGDHPLGTEAEGRFVFTAAGHQWFATAMIARLRAVLGDVPVRSTAVAESVAPSVEPSSTTMKG